MDIFLFRKPPVGNAVYGRLEIWNSDRQHVAELRTLENAACLIACSRGIGYRVTLTRSPRFGRDLPLVSGVAGRSAIRFHQGTRPEHSAGCILLSSGALNQVIYLLRQAEDKHEKVFLHVRDAE